MSPVKHGAHQGLISCCAGATIGSELRYDATGVGRRVARTGFGPRNVFRRRGKDNLRELLTLAVGERNVFRRLNPFFQCAFGMYSCTYVFFGLRRSSRAPPGASCSRRRSLFEPRYCVLYSDLKSDEYEFIDLLHKQSARQLLVQVSTRCAGVVDLLPFVALWTRPLSLTPAVKRLLQPSCGRSTL